MDVGKVTAAQQLPFRPRKADFTNESHLLKVLSSEIDPAEIRLIR
jgi:hypothetical protein